MGQQLHVDAAAMHAVADRLDASADSIGDAARTRLGRLGFGGVSAGQAHVAGGDALRRALDRWVPELAAWSRASAEIAAALRAAATGYVDAEQRSTARV